ncbi:hypothetical protein GCM10009105_37470 [Dokdonella soli]|uniref:Cation/H+ exchanger transmembrane domain-containing protein n=1 Tax=Dokdonella soli TaxID=529810 RepID=A0ABN1IZN0_9GAMM
MILAVGRALAEVIRRLGQPVVIAEMLTGFVLGPAALGELFPQWIGAVFPVSGIGGLQALGEIGLALFMFVVGAELCLPSSAPRGARLASTLVGTLSIAVPALLALAIAPLLFSYAPVGVAFWPFALFFSLAMATTAVPVMAHMLKERGQVNSDAGMISLSAATLGDVFVWLSLPLVLGIAKAKTDLAGATGTIMGLLVLVAIAMLLVRPLVATRWSRAPAGKVGMGTIGALLAGALTFAAITDWLGLHSVFGALLFGLCLPRDKRLLAALEDAILPISALVLLPCFFAVAGLNTTGDGFRGVGPVLILVLMVAIIGKLAGGAMGAKLAGRSWQTAVSVGVLMNTRGMMELVVLKIGYDAGLLSGTQFSMIFIMAIVTTAMTNPLLNLIDRFLRQPEPIGLHAASGSSDVADTTDIEPA